MIIDPFVLRGDRVVLVPYKPEHVLVRRVTHRRTFTR